MNKNQKNKQRMGIPVSDDDFEGSKNFTEGTKLTKQEFINAQDRIFKIIGKELFFNNVADIYLENEKTRELIFEQESSIEAMKVAIEGFRNGSLSIGAEISKELMPFIINVMKVREKIALSNQRSLDATHAFSQRKDQLLKPQWKAHVQHCVNEGIEINTIKDLLNIDNCKVKYSDISALTLKKWAKETVPGIKFKSGRPK